MQIEKAKEKQFQDVREFYYAVIDGIGDSEDSVGWKKDIYPGPQFLIDSIRNGELFVATEDEMIVGAMVLNHQFNDEYKKCHWPTQADDKEITLIHALAVHPVHKRKGIARQMVQFAVDYARENRQKVIRIDVMPRNRNAKKLYSGMGFKYLDTLQSFYEDVGWTEFELYEYPL